MRFTILGSGTTLPDPERGPAGFLLQHGSTCILVDGGSGTMQRLARAGVDARELDAGVYSHRHLDHIGDLAPLLFTMKVGLDKVRQRDYPLFGGAGLSAFLDGLRGVYGHWLHSERWAVPVTELPLDGPGRAQLPGGIRLDTLPARHSAGALHLRFTSPEGRSIVFSGDTGPNENLGILARDADLLVTECAVAEKDPWDSHLSPDDVQKVLEVARPKRVVLTHFYPGASREEALARLPGAELGFDGMILEV